VFPDSSERITAADLLSDSGAAAGAFAVAGIRPGAVVGLLAGWGPAFLTAFFGILRAGAAACVLPCPPLPSDDALVRRMHAIIDAGHIRHVISDGTFGGVAAGLSRLMPGLTMIDVSGGTGGADGRGSGAQEPALSPGDLAVVQYTSGSTGQPRGVALSHRSVLAGVDAIISSARVGPDDVLMHALPNFHDMGLISTIMQLLSGTTVHVVLPLSFLRRPVRFLRYFAENSGTMMAAPNFYYDHLLTSLKPDVAASLDLSAWRLAFNGAEPVRPLTAERFGEVLAPARIHPGVMYPVYGMAEATLAVTFPEPGTPVHVAQPNAGFAGRPAVSAGRPVKHMELRVVTDSGQACAAGEVGEIEIRGAAVMSGYLYDPAATMAAFRDGWLRTGDLGFQRHEELFVCGRSKEMVIAGGQNFFPDDIEYAARDVPGVFRGRCVAFADADESGNEFAAIVVETEAGPGDHDALRARIAGRVATETGLAAVRVHIVGPRWIPRTTSGKWQRGLARERLRPHAEQLSAE
jgi:acyl-CoA synthetase (AMP-forming)/AMP-acid ligase II